jgi:hypothetical protein
MTSIVGLVSSAKFPSPTQRITAYELAIAFTIAQKARHLNHAQPPFTIQKIATEIYEEETPSYPVTFSISAISPSSCPTTSGQ